MVMRFGSFAGWVGRRIPAVLTLALLAGVGVWGPANDWKVPALAGTPDPEDKEKESEKTRSIKISRDRKTGSEVKSLVIDQPRIEFPTAELVRASGIEVAPVKTRDMMQF